MSSAPVDDHVQPFDWAITDHGPNWSLVGQAKFLPLPKGSYSRTIPGSYLHTISNKTKRVLFKTYLATQATEAKRGEEVLRNLKRLAPRVAKQFELKQETIDSFTMRLITSASPEVKEESDQGSYLAVSYCWDERFKADPDVEYGQELTAPFDSLLFQAAIKQRLSSSEGLWIDQVCINQKIESEKRIAIPTMATLYRQARLVVILLADVSISTKERRCLEGLIAIFEKGRHVPVTPSFCIPDALEGFWPKFLRSRWFSRAWCSHELQLGKRHVFMIPCCSESNETQNFIFMMKGEFVWWLANRFRDIKTSLTEEGCEAFDTLVSCVFNQELMVRKHMEVMRKADRFFMLKVAAVMSLKTGGDPILPTELRILDGRRDKISILLNIAGIGLSLRRDQESLHCYFSDPEVSRQLLILGLAMGDVSLLTSGLKASKLDIKGSWMLFPEDGRVSKLINPALISLEGIQVDNSASVRWIQLEGAVLDQQSPPPASCVKLANIFIQKAIDLNLGEWVGGRLPLMPGVPGNQQEGNITRDINLQMRATLSAILHCGLEWFIEASRLTYGYYLKPDKDDYSGIFPNLVGHEEDVDDEVLAYRANETGLITILQFLQRLFELGAVTSVGAIGTDEVWMPRVYTGKKGGKVLIFSATEEIDTTSKSKKVSPGTSGFTAFIPLCLLEDDYSELSRCWLLEDKFDNEEHNLESEWNGPSKILRAKARVISSVPLLETCESWQRSQIRVYGAEH